MISDNYLSATVVSYQKKDCGSHFVPFSLHVLLLVSSTPARKAAFAFHFLSSFSPLSFLSMSADGYLAHPEPLGRAPGFTLTPGIFVIPGDFSFVLLCTHRAPGSSRPACGDFMFRPPSDWAFHASTQCMRTPSRSRFSSSFRFLSEPRPSQLKKTFFEPPAHRSSSFRMLSSVVLAIGLVHFTIRWSAPPFRRRNGGV